MAKAKSFDAKTFTSGLLSKLESEAVTLNPGMGKTQETGGSSSEFAWYFHHIFEEMYGVWQPPLGLGEGTTTSVLIRIEKNGIISKVSLAKSSGNKFMDDSALAAANHVKQLKPFPKSMGKDRIEVTVHFKIQAT
jgi:TonB family protein